MSLLLAVEPDSKQSAILKDIARRQLGAALVIVRSKDEAVAAIQKRLPDLILMSALVPPRDEAELNDHLRGVAGAEHIQTVSIPLLAHSTPKRPHGRGFDTFRRKRGKAVAASGCDPSIFGAEIAAYLKQAEELRPTRPEEEHEAEDLPAKAGSHKEEAPEAINVPVAAAPAEEEPEIVEAVVVVPAEHEEEISEPVAAVPPIVLYDAVRPDVSSLVGGTALFVEETAPFVNEPPPPILEDPPLPLACLAGVLAPPAPAVSPEKKEEKAEKEETTVAKIAEERIELWHPLPAAMHGAPPLQGPDIAPRVVVLAPIPAPGVETRALVFAAAPGAADAARATTVPSAAPDEWGFYNPSACGFEALMHTLQRIEAAAEPPPVDRPRRKKGTPTRASRPSIRSEAPDHPTTAAAPPLVASGTVTDEILQSLRLPSQIAALGRPTGCRIHKRKRTPPRRFRAGQRPPEPLIIVSKRMLELSDNSPW